MTKLFGTDGIRGLVNNEEINEELAFRLGKALIKYCQDKKIKPEIIIGRDTRESGPLLEMAVSQGITEAGGKITSVGVIPTPGIAYLVKKENAGLGLVISASHNTYEYNGFKIFKNDGTKLTDAEENEIERLVLEDKSPLPLLQSGGQAFVKGGLSAVKNTEINNHAKNYSEFLVNCVRNLDLSGMKIALDCANGATSKIAPEIFKKLGSELVAISCDPDGKNINANCGSEHTENLQQAVIKNNANLGLAFDGDGDRLIAINEKGERLTGDHVIYFCAKMLLEKNELKNFLVVSTAMSNIGLREGLKTMGVEHITAGIGDRAVFFEMQKRDAVLGGEESGHIIFLDRHTTGDGILSGLMITAALRHFQRPLSELAQELVLLPKILLNIKVASKPDLAAIPEIKKIIEDAEKYFSGQGRVMVRYSGTEPVCRVMIEGKDEKEIKEWAKNIGEKIKNKLNYE